MPKLLSHSLRFYGYGLAIIIISIAVLVQSLRLLAPQVDTLRPSLEQWLGEQMQAEVSLGKINASWYGLLPHVLVDHIHIKTPAASGESTPVLEVANADLALDLLSSALEQRWVWKRVAFSQIKLGLQQDSQGQWLVAGLPISSEKTSTDESWNYRSPRELFRQISQIDITDADIHLAFASGRELDLRLPSIKIENSSGFHRLTASGTLQDQEVLSLVLESQEGEGASNYLSGYVQLKQLPIQQLAEALGLKADQIQTLLPLISEETIKGAMLNSQLWLDFSGSRAFEWVGDVQLSTGGQENHPQGLSTRFYGNYELDKGWDLGVRDTQLDQTTLIEQLMVRKADEHIEVLLGDLSLSQWLSRVEPLLVDKPRARAKLAKLNPKAELENLSLQLRPEQWQDSSLSVIVKNASIDPADNIPGIDNIRGYLEAQLMKGFINLDAQDFELHPSRLYENPIVFDEISAQLAWSIDPEANHIFLNTSQIKASADFGEANGYFSLDIPWTSGSRPSDFVLYLGLQNSSAEHYASLAPVERLPEELNQWLAESLESGQVSDAGFIYRGGFSGADSSRTIQLFLDVDQVNLNYSSDWPALKDARGQVLIDNRYVQVDTTKAVLAGQSIDKISVVRNNTEHNEINVKVASQVPASFGLYMLNHSWLRSKVGDTFVRWSASGDLSVAVDVDVPLEDVNPEDYEPRQQVSIDFLDTDIYLEQQNIQLDELKGRLHYSGDKGLFSEDLSLYLFDNELPVVIRQQGENTREGEYLSVRGQSRVAIDTLSDWLSMPELNLISGELPYFIDLKIPFAEDSPYRVKLDIASDLQGVSSPLPPPLLKGAEQVRRFSLSGLINESSQKYSLLLDDSLSVSLENRDDIWAGSLALGAGVKQTASYAPNSFSINAVFDDLSLEPWIDVFDKAQTLSQRRQDTKATPLRLNYALDIKRLTIRDQVFDDVAIAGNRRQGQWQVALQNKEIKGQAVIDESFAKPVELAIDYLNLPKAEEGESAREQDPLAGVDLSWLKESQVLIKQLKYGEQDLGRWQFVLKPEPNGVRLDGIQGDFSEMRFSSIEGTKGASLVWFNDDNPKRAYTRLEGRLSGENFQGLLESFGLAPVLESQSTEIDVALKWDGSPAFFAIKRAEGWLELNMDEGIFTQEKNNPSTGILRLLGLFNFNTWTRRLKLDFSDLYKKGVVFDNLSARLSFDRGWIYLQQPLVLKAPSSEFTMAGSIDYVNENIDTVLVTTLPVGGNLTFAAALAAGLPAAAGVYIISKVFKPQVDKVSSLTYAIKGSWNKPKVTFLNLFDNSTKKKEPLSSDEEFESPPES